jgi:hypothetical protein
MPRHSSPCHSDSSISIDPTSPVADGAAAERTRRERRHVISPTKPAARTASMMSVASANSGSNHGSTSTRTSSPRSRTCRSHLIRLRARSAERVATSTSAASALPSRNGRDRLVARIGPCSAVAGAARPHGRAAGNRSRRTGARRDRGLGCPVARAARRRRAVGWRGVFPRRTFAVTSRPDGRGRRSCPP